MEHRARRLHAGRGRRRGDAAGPERHRTAGVRLHLRLRRRALRRAAIPSGSAFPARRKTALLWCECEGLDRLRPQHERESRRADMLLLSFPVRSSGMQRLIGRHAADVTDPDNATFETIRSRSSRCWKRRSQGELVCGLPRSPSRGRTVPRGAGVPAGRRGAHPQPGRGPGHEHRHRRCDESRLEACRRRAGRARETLLDTFEEERIGFARTLVATTDRAFSAMVAPGSSRTLTRRLLAPLAIAIATKLPATRRAFFRVISQTQIHYPESALSEGSAGKIRGGDRLPWVASADNFGRFDRSIGKCTVRRTRR